MELFLDIFGSFLELFGLIGIPQLSCRFDHESQIHLLPQIFNDWWFPDDFQFRRSDIKGIEAACDINSFDVRPCDMPFPNNLFF